MPYLIIYLILLSFLANCFGQWIKFCPNCGEFPISAGLEDLSVEGQAVEKLIEAAYQFTEIGHCTEAELCKVGISLPQVGF